MVLQILAKGDAIGFKPFTKSGQDMEELVCVNPVSAKVKYALSHGVPSAQGVGTAFGQEMVTPDQRMLEQVRDMVNKMDMKSGLVVPFYVNLKTHGTDGQVLNVEDKGKEVMMVMIREIKQAARKLISRSSLQIKMDPDPDIEAANRETERKQIDLMDEKQVKPVVDMVVSGMTPTGNG